MPTYEFHCAACGEMIEQVFPMSGMPDSVACVCGSAAARQISANGNVVVKNTEYQFRKDRIVRSFGHGYGRSVRQQHDGYVRYFEDLKKRKREVKAQKKTNAMEWIGGMPGEMVDSIGLHEGDPEAVLKDPVTFLKKTGTYAGD